MLAFTQIECVDPLCHFKWSLLQPLFLFLVLLLVCNVTIRLLPRHSSASMAETTPFYYHFKVIISDIFRHVVHDVGDFSRYEDLLTAKTVECVALQRQLGIALDTYRLALAARQSAHEEHLAVIDVRHKAALKELETECVALKRQRKISDRALEQSKRSSALLGARVERMKEDMREYSFTSFLERLVLSNRLWQQEKEIQSLRAALHLKDKAISANAFSSFRDRLLLSNRIWHQEKNIKSLRSNCKQSGVPMGYAAALERKVERLKRARITTISAMAKATVSDARKESLTEELVKELVGELESNKKQVIALRTAHRQTVDEINGEWIKDYRQLVKEVDKLKLGQKARLAEQEVSNQMEESLLQSLKRAEEKVQQLEDKLAECQTIIDGKIKYDALDGTQLGSGDIAQESSHVPFRSISSSDDLSTESSESSDGEETSTRVGSPSPTHRKFTCCDDHGLRSPSSFLLAQASIESSLLNEDLKSELYPARNAFSPLSPLHVDPVLPVDAESLSASAINDSNSNSITKSIIVKRAPPVPLRLPLWPPHPGQQRVACSNFVGRATKKVKADL